MRFNEVVCNFCQISFVGKKGKLLQNSFLQLPPFCALSILFQGQHCKRLPKGVIILRQAGTNLLNSIGIKTQQSNSEAIQSSIIVPSCAILYIRQGSTSCYLPAIAFLFTLSASPNTYPTSRQYIVQTSFPLQTGYASHGTRQTHHNKPSCP